MLNPKYKNVKAVLFDCDGVICKLYEFAKVIDRDYGITMAMTKDFFVNVFPECAVNNIDILSVLPKYLINWGWTQDSNSFLNLWLDSEKNTESDVIQIVKRVKDLGIITGLATNQEIHRARYMRNVMKLTEYFDELFISSELEAMKPNQEFFEKVTRKLNLKPNQILFIDDQQNYIEAASALGWQVYQFQSAKDLRQILF